MNRTSKIHIGIFTLLASIITGCTAGSRTLEDGNRSAANASSSTRLIAVNVFEAQPSNSTTAGDLLIPAALSVENTAIVLAEREGRITRLGGQEGARVDKGDVLAEFNADDQHSQLRQAELEVSRLKVEEQQYEALVKLNKSELDRELLLARQNISSKSDVERAEYKLDQSRHEYEKTQLATQSGQARVEAVKIEIAKSTVRAPIRGIVTRRYVTLGTNVARNDKLFEVSQLSPLKVKFQLPQSEKGRLNPGQIVNLSSANSDALIASARIRRIDPLADATSNTLGYLADVVSGSGLIPGLAVNVHLPRAAAVPSFWIPRAAFAANAELQNGTLSTIWVVEGDKTATRLVQVKTVEGDQVEIVSGLNVNERVILTPSKELKEGDVVEVNSPQRSQAIFLFSHSSDCCANQSVKSAAD